MKYLNKKYGNNVYPNKDLFPTNNIYPASAIGLIPRNGLVPRTWLKPNGSKHNIISAKINGKNIIEIRLGNKIIIKKG